MSAIFISHSSADNAIAGDLKSELARIGHRSLFLDFDPEHGIPLGRDWERELYAQLRDCQAMIVLCSAKSMASPWCFAEITHARSQGKPVFPLIVGDCEVWPLLSDIQITNLTDGYQRLFDGLAAAGLDPKGTFDWDGSRPPYPGLEAFETSDAAVYFGRESAIHSTIAVLNRLRRMGGPRMALVLGASGCGKSSLMRAGVAPRLARDQDHWLVVEPFRPSMHPFDELAMALAGVGKGSDWKAIRDALKSDSVSARWRDVVNDLRVSAGCANVSLLVVIDQFEALLSPSSDETSRFLRLLKSLTSSSDSPVLLVATLRSDFLSAFQTHPALLELDYEPIPVPQMATKDLEQVIEGPAKVADVTIEPGLARAMADDTATSNSLPLLAFTLRELWDHLGPRELWSRTKYLELGGLQGAVARAAEGICSEGPRSAVEIDLLRKCLVGLVRIDEENRYVRRPRSWADMPQAAQPLLERFVQARLLVSRGEGGSRILDVAHEALFRSWDRLAGWIKADQDFLHWRRRLRGKREEWERNKSDLSLVLRGPLLAEAESWFNKRKNDLEPSEQEFVIASITERDAEERRQRQVKVGLTLAAVFFALLSALFVWKWQQSESLTTAAQAEALAATAESLAQDYPDQSLLLAIEAHRLHRTPKADFLLRAAGAAYPYRTVLRGHKEAVDSAQFTADGNKVLTAGRDNTARLWDATSGKELRALVGHTDAVTTARFSNDETMVVTTSVDKTARIWDVVSGNAIQPLLGHKGAVTSAQFSDDGKTVVTASRDGTARQWLVATGQEVKSLLEHDDVVTCAQLSPDGTMVLTGSLDGTARLWDVRSGGQPRKLLGHTSGIVGAQFSADGKTVLTASDDKTARMWDAASGRLLRTLHGHKHRVSNAQFSADGKTVLTASDDKTARLWDAVSGNELRTLLGHEGRVASAHFSADGKMVLTASDDKTARLWDAASGEQLRILRGHEGRVASAQLSADGKTVVTSSDDNTARLWSLVSSAEEASLRGHDKQIVSAEFSVDGKTVLTASADNTARLWNGTNGDALPVLRGHAGRVNGAQFSHNGKMAVTASEDRTARLWEVSSGKELLPVLSGHVGRVSSAQFSPDDKTVLTASYDKTAKLWDITGGRVPRPLSGHGEPVIDARFSVNGRTVVTASGDGTARLWDAANGRELLSLIGHELKVSSAQFSRDGKTILTTSDDQTARLWDVSTGSNTSLKHAGIVTNAQFAPDSKTILTASRDKTAKLWPAATAKGSQATELQTLRGHEGSVTDARFSPDGSIALTASEDRTARLWDMATGRELRKLPHEAPVSTVRFSPDGTFLTASATTARLWRCDECRPIGEIAINVVQKVGRDLTREERLRFRLAPVAR